VGPRRRAVLGTLATVRILRPRGAGLAVGARVPVDVRPVPPPELPRSTGGRAVDGRRGADVIQTGAVRRYTGRPDGEHDPHRQQPRDGGESVKVGSLFSGIGGFDLGLERAGMEVVWQVEIDPFCRRVLAKHWPDVKRYEDVRDVGAHNLEAVDVIAGGFPCQPVSQAGHRLAQDDDRWLWPEFARIVRDLRPRIVLVENVPGLLVRGMGDVLGDLASLGYDAEWESIPAAALGAPHVRDRVLLVAHPSGERLERRGDRRTGLEAQPIGLFPTGPTWWSSEPSVERVDDGTPGRVDRLRSLGNAVVPDVAHWIGSRIMESLTKVDAYDSEFRAMLDPGPLPLPGGLEP